MKIDKLECGCFYHLRLFLNSLKYNNRNRIKLLVKMLIIKIIYLDGIVNKLT